MSAPVMPVFVDPVVGGEPGPGWGELLGRSVAVVPTSVGVSKAYAGATNADANGNVPTVWYDIFIVDGGPLTYGAAPKANPPRPFPTHQISTPCVFRGQMSSHVNIYRALAPWVGKNSFVRGVVGQSDVGNKPYIIVKFEPGDPRDGQLQQVVTGLINGSTPEPQPVPLNFAPTAQPAAQPQPQYAPPAAAAPMAAPAPMTPPAPMQDPAAMMVQLQQQLAAAQAAAAAVSPTGAIPRPASVPEAFWATLSTEQQQMLAAQAAQIPAPVAGNPF